MENALTALGMLFMLFLVLATAAEQIVETLRGALQSVGIKILKGGVTVAEATRLSGEFLPPGSEARAKADALLAVAQDYPRTLQSYGARIEAARASVGAAVSAVAPGSTLVADATAQVNRLALEISGAVEKTEQVRVMVLRLISFAACLGLCWATQFNAMAIVARAFPDFAAGLAGWPWAGMMATAIAASAGSSYWHDQLDKLRAVKTAVTSIRTAAGPVASGQQG